MAFKHKYPEEVKKLLFLFSVLIDLCRQ
jgi:hypothetical protein